MQPKPTPQASPEYGGLPHFLVIGAQRSGTTLFYELLCLHPFVARAKRKEVHYFDRDFAEGETHYRSFFPTEEGMVTGEATPYYLFHPEAPERAKALVPDASLIALLRNPADRAYSHWRLQTERGNETLPFEEALEAEDGRLSGTGPEDKAHRVFSYRSRGIYAPQVARWLDAYGSEALMVLKAETFYKRSADVLKRVHKHLGLEPEPTHKPLDEHAKNATRGPPMRPETRRDLEAFFAPSNEQLYDLLGRDLKW